MRGGLDFWIILDRAFDWFSNLPNTLLSSMLNTTFAVTFGSCFVSSNLLFVQAFSEGLRAPIYAALLSVSKVVGKRSAFEA
jgi:hypothetical protein